MATDNVIASAAALALSLREGRVTPYGAIVAFACLYYADVVACCGGHW